MISIYNCLIKCRDSPGEIVSPFTRQCSIVGKPNNKNVPSVVASDGNKEQKKECTSLAPIDEKDELKPSDIKMSINIIPALKGNTDGNDEQDESCENSERDGKQRDNQEADKEVINVYPIKTELVTVIAAKTAIQLRNTFLLP